MTIIAGAPGDSPLFEIGTALTPSLLSFSEASTAALS